MSTTVKMAFDRIEIRAAQPLGSHLHSSMFAYNDQSTEPKLMKQYAHNFFVIDLSDYRQDVGWIEVGSHIQRPSIMHGIHQQKFDKTNADHVYREAEVDDLNEFHTYSLVWNQSLAQFSFDHNHTEPFSNHLHRTNTTFQIVLMIGVGGTHFHEPMPENFTHLNWICPALIVDYIRVFDKVSQTENLPKCQFPEPMTNDKITDICQYALSKSSFLTPTSPKSEKLTTNNSFNVALITSIVLTGILFVPVIMFVLIKLGYLENPISKFRTMYSKDESIISYARQADVHSQSQTVNEVSEFKDF